MNLRLTAAVAVGKLLIWLLRALGRAGTTLPGRVALLVAPDLISLTCATVGERIIVTGTNGKTTTSAMLEAVLRRAGRRVVRNVSGANLASGAASSLIAFATLGGRLRGDTLILEVDEAAAPALAPHIRPHCAIVTNLFRDQLDRFGELDRITALVRSSLGAVRDVVCLNADDPGVAHLAEGLPAGCRPVMYGMELSAWQQRERPEERVGVDVKHCPQCSSRFAYSFTTYGHLGQYRCPQCNLARPPLHVMGLVTTDDEAVGGSMNLRFADEFAAQTGSADLDLRLRLPGIYNAYNATAVAAGAAAMGVAAEHIRTGLENFSGAFGRMERILLEDGEFSLALVKNPAGFNEVLRTVRSDGEDAIVVLAVNDRAADGRDISWLWDVRFTPFAGRPGIRFVASGLRAHDMAVRLKYSEVSEERIGVQSDPSSAVREALRVAGESTRVYVLCTYTAMLALRTELSSRGVVSEVWETP